ncbi:hypothetical protein PCIT_b0250 [Pseudoalteromonas citrea]|uniref:4'-phosphopantetheinyl transferase domain-containing protein n=2 Tax=Pseudoalteromonas citrea TaxID=43655 RepID=A0AAD4AE68_9GAMM|nr:4'-phosphopantetheinyl transferase family protein [Pseudoalteromonas citrea]KAF7764290.1 hypothetical protein PCIT_b0250 [Pseudoalteromonas citrea]
MLSHLTASTTSDVYAVYLPQLMLRLQVPAMQQQLMSHLSTDELDTYQCFIYKKPALSWLGARLAAKWLLKKRKCHNATTKQLSLTKNTKGAPFCAISGEPVGISHTSDLAIAALSESPFGIDTEHQNRFDTAPVPWFSSNELVLGNNQTIPSATQLWCFKEALYKAVGHGPFITFCQTVRITDWHTNRVTIAPNPYTEFTYWHRHAWQLHNHDILLTEPIYD